MQIHVLHRQGRSIRQIARTLGGSHNTFRHCLPDVARTPIYRRPKRIYKLEPFKTYLLEFLNAAEPEWTTAAVLFRELQEQGHQGKESTLKNWLRPTRRLHKNPSYILRPIQGNNCRRISPP